MELTFAIASRQLWGGSEQVVDATSAKRQVDEVPTPPPWRQLRGKCMVSLSQLTYKCHLEEVASVGDCLNICPQLDSRMVSFKLI